MPYMPDVSEFVRFYDLHHSTQDHCIYIVEQEAIRRCKWPCRDDARERAVELRRLISQCQVKGQLLEYLTEYIQSNCCREGRAQHRDRILNVGLLYPLAQRWLGEIMARRAQEDIQRQSIVRATPETPSPARWSSYRSLSQTPNTYSSHSSSSTSTFSRQNTIFDTPSTTPPPNRSSRQLSPFCSDSKPDASPTPLPRAFRCEQVSSSAILCSKLAARYDPANLSQFQPHIEDPFSAKNTVSNKLRAPFEDRDNETGTVYIFCRDSSPEHVKIGWTANPNVQVRLDGWAESCGYSPELVCRIKDIPNAQRVETLIHHQLVNEWRRERMCKTCKKSHQEWFEIEEERVVQVLGAWAELFKKAKPYDSRGLLKAEFRILLESLEVKGEIVTGARLLERFNAPSITVAQTAEVTIVETSVDIERISNVKGDDTSLSVSKIRTSADDPMLDKKPNNPIPQPGLLEKAPLEKNGTTAALPFHLKDQSKSNEDPFFKAKSASARTLATTTELLSTQQSTLSEVKIPTPSTTAIDRRSTTSASAEASSSFKVAPLWPVATPSPRSETRLFTAPTSSRAQPRADLFSGTNIFSKFLSDTSSSTHVFDFFTDASTASISKIPDKARTQRIEQMEIKQPNSHTASLQSPPNLAKVEAVTLTESPTVTTESPTVTNLESVAEDDNNKTTSSSLDNDNTTISAKKPWSKNSPLKQTQSILEPSTDTIDDAQIIPAPHNTSPEDQLIARPTSDSDVEPDNAAISDVGVSAPASLRPEIVADGSMAEHSHACVAKTPGNRVELGSCAILEGDVSESDMAIPAQPRAIGGSTLCKGEEVVATTEPPNVELSTVAVDKEEDSSLSKVEGCEVEGVVAAEGRGENSSPSRGEGVASTEVGGVESSTAALEQAVDSLAEVVSILDISAADITTKTDGVCITTEEILPEIEIAIFS